jgi:hypothetical protein
MINCSYKDIQDCTYEGKCDYQETTKINWEAEENIGIICTYGDLEKIAFPDVAEEKKSTVKENLIQLNINN